MTHRHNISNTFARVSLVIFYCNRAVLLDPFEGSWTIQLNKFNIILGNMKERAISRPKWSTNNYKIGNTLWFKSHHEKH